MLTEKRLVIFFLFFLLSFLKLYGGIIEVKGTDFISTNYLEKEDIDKIKKTGYLVGCGEAEYQFEIPESSWYEFYVKAAKWDTELYLDGEFLIYTVFDSGVWESKEKETYKVMNIYLTKGTHKIKFSRPWFPGLPYMTKFYFQKSEDITGMVRLIPQKDYLVFRKGESFPLKLIAGRLKNPYNLILSITDNQTNEDIKNQILNIPEGEGNYESVLLIPTDTEGVFDIKLKDEKGNFCDRVIQYLVIDTEKNPLKKGGELEKELLYVIDCAKVSPDYYSSPTRVINSFIGSYRESGPMGREKGCPNADWFAYILNIPEIQKPYLIEIEYPDNERRTTAIVLVERFGAPQPAVGYFSGGFYPLSNKMQKMEFYIFPRDKDPRLLFYNWDTGRRSAVSKIYVYRIKEFKSLSVKSPERLYGIYQEEPMRYTYFYGAMAKGNDFLNLWKTAERVCVLSSYSGINLWYPTIAVYQCMLWPSRFLPGYKIGIFPEGPLATNQPVQTDVMRIMLLTCEKYNMKFVGDLHIPIQWNLMKYLDKRFGGKGTFEDDGYHKGWLTVSNKGEVGLKSNYKPYYNPVYPEVQKWVEDIVKEIAERYKDSPSFLGLSLRVAGWVPAGWQTFGSINWGYDDYTISLFEKDTGIKIPVSKDDPERFQKRYEFLISNHYDEWVGWRCKKIYEYHSRIAKVLTGIRPDLKLYIFLNGANFANDVSEEDYEKKGWLGILKETGIDPSLYRNNPSIVLFEMRGYPDGGNRGDERVFENAFQRDHSFSTEQIRASEKPSGDGTISALFFSTNHEGPYVKYDKLGYTKEESEGHLKIVYPDSTVNPAGIHYLERYANAMADGNIVFLADGCHGYELGQPKYLKEFLKEFLSLPLIGMKPVGNCDPIAIWYGKLNGKTYFYVVNRTYYPVEAEIYFENGSIKIRRLSTNEIVKVVKNKLNLKLNPYQLISYVEENGFFPLSVKTKIPEDEERLLKKQIEEAEKILNGETEESSTVLNISIKDLQKAQEKLNEAKEFYRKGMYWKTRQTLMHRYLIKIYEETRSYPENLFFSTLLKIPENSFLPDEIYQNVKNKEKVRVVDGERINGYFKDIKVILCKNNTEINIELPYKSKYKVIFGKLKEGDIEVFLNGEKLKKGGTEKSGLSEQIISNPIILKAGRNKMIIKTKKEVPLLYFSFQPVFTDIKPEKFFVIGPFEGGNIRISEEVYKKMSEVGIIEKEEIDLRKEYIGIDNKKVGWKKAVEGKNMCDLSPNYVDIYKMTGALGNIISYAFTTIESPEDRNAEISFGADYWGKIIVNGKVVFTPDKRPPAPPRKGENIIPIELKRGKNSILIKIHSGSAGNGFWMSITDPGDLKIGGEI